ncbi:MAG: damage-inducible protein DinB [Rhodobacterales bacterium]|nr:damage-inducible protein DinB [Rhodobacterales bacterium]
MTPDHARRLARYNAWANKRLYAACALLPENAYYQDRGAYFGSLHGTLNHILVGDRAWMGRLTKTDPHLKSLDQILYDTFMALRAARQAEDEAIVAYTETLKPADMRRVVRYRAMAGTPHEDPVGLILAHMFNHGTHHRGQAHGLLSQVPMEPPALDLIFFVREEEKAAALEQGD